MVFSIEPLHLVLRPLSVSFISGARLCDVVLEVNSTPWALANSLLFTPPENIDARHGRDIRMTNELISQCAANECRQTCDFNYVFTKYGTIMLRSALVQSSLARYL